MKENGNGDGGGGIKVRDVYLVGDRTWGLRIIDSESYESDRNG